MNRILEIATALAGGWSVLASGSEAVIDAPEGRTLSVLRSDQGPALRWRLGEQPVGLTADQEDAVCEALLRLGADSRWMAGYAGGLDPQGGFSVLATVPTGALEADQICQALDQLTGQLRQTLQPTLPGDMVIPNSPAKQEVA